MKGVTSEGVIKEAAGIILNTNRPGHYGSMHVKVTVSKKPGTKGGALVETYGWAHLSVGDETRDFWWNPAPGNNAFLPGVPIHIATIDYGSIPNANVRTWTSWHRLEGTADSKGLSLEASEKTFSNKRYPDFFTGQQIIATKRNGGWDYMVKYRFRAYPAKFKEYIKYVIRGNLQDKN
ncbi:hypothetical protein Pmar_PMAR014743 [Perkinsus marinus ATCC 50983]|uniref:Uncharacterized protein n=1 Tax=Perkinsus marinus (strain ATCC 50983 / TXsc) TaxID=423536 RepID=C5KIG9_PERM5|nr:hypothetical protein Pmar_PMAR014743 [Perkinsus marinus ATCC 50983]EER15724.1 hypothetical protein Pmar_PMAR014743 [Perkinsus marinus ATCC 50983]|eukprot:XP_002783928.1 hypothetical protein Pmar_PMAR014743 [Perkinsus marinus ATCC 50983]